jgi:hypothetical protein
MLTNAELDSPARLSYGRANLDAPGEPADWSAGREFATLREAVHVAMTESAPAGTEPYIMVMGNGRVLAPSTLHNLFESLQGP